MKKIGSEDKTLRLINAKKHGILYEDTGHTQTLILDFINQSREHTCSIEGTFSKHTDNQEQTH